VTAVTTDEAGELTPTGPEHLDAAGVVSAVFEAARPVTATWPLDTFVATNPLAWLEDRPFAEAVQEANRIFGPGRVPATPAEVLDERDGGDRASRIDEQVATWCRLVIDDHATWAAPGRDKGLWTAWRTVTSADRRLTDEGRGLARRLSADPAEAVAVLLAEAGVRADQATARLRGHLTALPGWTAVIRAGHRTRPGIDLVSYAAVRLAVERLVIGADLHDLDLDLEPDLDRWVAPDARSVSIADLAELEAAEATYRDGLLGSISRSASVRNLIEPTTPPGAGPAPAAIRPPVQLLCCIDVRSEGLRRHVERLGRWETFGVAGFFGLAIRLQRSGEHLATDRSPVIVTPAVDAREVLDGAPIPDARPAADDAFHVAKEGVAAPLALAEVAGWGAGVVAAWRTFCPGGSAGGGRRRQAAGRIELPASTTAERVDLAHGLLRTVGLTSGFARTVIVCGHGSDTRNNPFAAGLTCGACGGHPGGDNARLAAALLGDEDVRAGLAERGIEIPADTCFVAAEHDTASDEVVLLDVHADVGESHEADLAAVEAVLAAAGADLRSERAIDLPDGRRWGSARRQDRRRRARGRDWAEAVPEWGLAGNAAFVIGPRSSTAGVDLRRRVFLHSYAADQDPDGAVLGAIFGGPVVVAHWISSQYLFSSWDPEVFGAGTKATHNVVGDFGVLSGPSGDLRRGLPLQSVALPGHRGHQPLRLLVVVEAPLERVEACLDANPTVADLVGGDWLALAARPDPGSPWSRKVATGWEAWS
jgi:uncharacterized protein YbcC (UPF0753/DUF2309 family)